MAYNLNGFKNWNKKKKENACRIIFSTIAEEFITISFLLLNCKVVILKAFKKFFLPFTVWYG